MDRNHHILEARRACIFKHTQANPGRLYLDPRPEMQDLVKASFQLTASIRGVEKFQAILEKINGDDLH